MSINDIFKMEEYMNLIIKETGLSKDEILAFINDKKESLKGLLSDFDALLCVARDLAVELEEETHSIESSLERWQNRLAYIKEIVNTAENGTEGDSLVDEIFEILREKGWGGLLGGKRINRSNFSEGCSLDFNCSCQGDFVFLNYVQDGSAYRCVECGKITYIM